MQKPAKPRPDFPLFAHANGQWAKKIKGKLHYFGPWDDPQGAENVYLSRLHSTQATPVKVAAPKRPGKPYPDYKLYAHPSGQWAKTIRGKTMYFGPWADPDAALARYNAYLEGKPLRPVKVTVDRLVNEFLHEKKGKVPKELSMRTWREYKDIAAVIKDTIGAAADFEKLSPSDFLKLRNVMAKGCGLVTLGNKIKRARVIFNWGRDTYHPGRLVSYGQSFKMPSHKSVKREQREKPRRFLDAPAIRACLRKATPQMKAMILLGVNCGLGNNDCALLRESHLAEAGWLNYPRPKTGVERRSRLWPETVKAIEKVREKRHRPNNPEHADHIFIMRTGELWTPRASEQNENKLSASSPISKRFSKLLKAVGHKQKGVSFYALRHTTQSIGDQTRYGAAVKHIMGHEAAANDMSARYNELAPLDTQLTRVAKYIRRWLKRSGRKIQVEPPDDAARRAS